MDGNFQPVQKVNGLTHKDFTKRIITERRAGTERIAKDRFAWVGYEQLNTYHQPKEKQEEILARKFSTVYRLEGEEQRVLPDAEAEERGLSDKEKKKRRKEREAAVKESQKNIMAANKELLKELPDTEITEETIKNRFENEPYSYEIANEFTPEAVLNNYAASKRKLDEILTIAADIRNQYNMSRYDSNEATLKFGYDFLKFAECCKHAFENALAVNGLRYKDESSTELVRISYKESEKASKEAAQSNDAILNVFKKGFYDIEKDIVDRATDELLASWTHKDYYAYLESHNLENPIPDMHNRISALGNTDAVLQRLYEDYIGFESILTSRMAAIEVLESEKTDPTPGSYFDEDNYDFAGHIDNKIVELNAYIDKSVREKNFIRDIIDSRLNGDELTMEQRMYMAAHYNAQDEELYAQCSDRLMQYKAISNEYFHKSGQEIDTADTIEKIDDTCKLLKREMSMESLLNIQETLYRLSEIIQKSEDNVIYFGTPSQALKSNKIITFAKKARAVALFNAAKINGVSREHLTLAEYERMTDNNGGAFTDEDVLQLAREMYANADMTYVNARRQFVNNKEVWINFNTARENLSAGTSFDEEELSADTMQENSAELERMKDNMRTYFEGVYAKYGLELPQLELLADNPSVILEDFKYCRQYFKFANSEVIFDDNIETDKNLKELILFYGEMINCFDMAAGMVREENNQFGKIEAELKSFWNDHMKIHADYIRQNMVQL